MTITELARRIGVTTAYLADIEKRPHKRPPTPRRVRDVVAVLELRPEEATELRQLATIERLPREFRGKVQVRVEIDRPAAAPPELVAEQAALMGGDAGATLPLLAEVPAGDARAVHDEVIEERAVPRSIARTGRYLLRVSGRSMAPILEHGDIVLVDGAVRAADGSIVAARIADGAEDRSTIKQLFSWPDRVLLHPLNLEFDDMILLRSGELDESGSELFDLGGRRVRLFLKGVVTAIVWRELSTR